MYIDVLFIGTAPDGPDGEIYVPSAFSDIAKRFGWWNQEWFTLTSSTSSIVLSKSVWNNNMFQIYNQVIDKTLPTTLYNTVCSGNTLTFGNTGTSGLYLVEYVTEPEDTNIVFAYGLCNPSDTKNIGVFRVPGVKASVNIGDITLQARNSGTLYNNINVSVSSSSITIYWNREDTVYTSYTYLTSSLTLVKDINTDFEYFIHPLKAVCNVSSPNVNPGNYTTSGGTVGDFSNITLIADLIDFSNVGTVVLAGGASSGTVQAFLNYFDLNGIPSPLLVYGDQYNLYNTYNTLSSYKTFVQSQVINHRQAMYVSGWGKIPDGTYFPNKFTSLCNIVGALSTNDITIVNKPTNLTNIVPFWSKQDLADLRSNTVVFTNFIKNGLGCFSANNTFGDSYIKIKSKIDVTKIVSEIVSSYIGRNDLPQNTLNSKLDEGISRLNNIKDYSFTTEYVFDTIYINIAYNLFGETDLISLSISSKVPNR